MATKVQTKKKVEEPEPETSDAPDEFVPSTEAGEFNLNEEYKPTPLVPGGKYYGNTVKVQHKTEDETILWEVVLAENGGVCNDGETPVDGFRLFTRNYLPKTGDESEMTKDGRMNKRQAKINMLTSFAEGMGVDMNSKAIIKASILNQEWLGIPVVVDVTVREYEGRFSNDIKRMTRRKEEE